MIKKQGLSSITVVLAVLMMSFTSLAGNFYWVNGGGSWTDVNHWSYTSGGSTCGTVPGENDNIYFDESSFSSLNEVVFISNDAVIKSLNLSTTKYPVFEGSGINITLRGDLNLKARAHFNLGGELIFNAIDGKEHKIATADNDIASDVRISGGSWSMENSLKTNMSHDMYLASGSLVTNGETVYGDNIYGNIANFNLDASNSFVIVSNGIFLGRTRLKETNAKFLLADGSPIPRDSKGNISEFSNRDRLVNCIGASPLVLETIITTDYNGFDISCADECDGELLLQISGSPGPFGINFENGPFTKETSFDNICVGSLTIVVIDSSREIAPGSGFFLRCTIDDFFNEPSAVTLGFDGFLQSSCPGICDARAFTSPGGGAGGLSVFWPGSGETTPNPSALCAGDNAAILTDVNGCILNETFNIAEKPAFNYPATITPPSCNGDCDGEIAPNPSGGNGAPFTFTWAPVPLTSGQGSDPGVGFCAGIVTMTVEDASGCLSDTTYEIIAPPVLSLTVSGVEDALCNASCTGEAQGNPAGGVGPYTIEWFDDATGLTTGFIGNTVNTLCAGDYFARVTDASGCIIPSAPFTINEPTAIASSAVGSSVSCPGDCDGTADGTVLGGTPPYTYSWVTSPGGVGNGASEDLTGLCAGDYELTVTDDNGCVDLPIIITVTEPLPLGLAITGDNPSCYDLCDGSANAVVNGGTPPYGYAWTPAVPIGAGTDSPSDMCAGTYDLRVTDFAGCIITDNVVLSAPPLYDITPVLTQLACSGDANGAIDLTVNAGGSGAGYTFAWAPIPPAGNGTPNVSGLTAGAWMVTIADSRGCDTTITFNITTPTPLTITTSVISQVACFEDCNGSARVNIVGGVPAYNILWDDPGAQTNNVASGLCAGTYNVTVTDANLCVVNESVIITEPTPYDVTLAQTTLDCFGDCDATATVTVNGGGTPAYTYLWSDPFVQTTPTAIGLCAGSYTCILSDGNACDTTINFTIVEPPELTVVINSSSSSCFGSCDGEADIIIAGGTPGYTIEWFDAVTLTAQGVNNTAIMNLCPSDYFAEVTDLNGCTVRSNTVTITELPIINVNIVSQTNTACGICDGTAELNATGGAGMFTFDWTPDPTVSGDAASVTGLCGGNYNVVVTDITGCTQNMAVTVNSSAAEVLDLDSTDASCFGVCDGTTSATFVPIDPPYTIEWFDDASGMTTGVFGSPAGPFCAGTYTAVLTNASGCVVSESIVINEPTAITGTIATTSVDCFGDCDGDATATAVGGTGTLAYNWSPLPGAGQGTASASGLCAGNWTVTVTDDNACFIDLVGVISEPVVLTITTESSTDISCFGLIDGTASILVAGGVAPYSYNWIDCATGLPTGQTTPLAGGLPAGSYQAIVTDDNGCVIMGTCQTVVEPAEIAATLNEQFVSCFGDCDGLIDAVVAGGVAPYFFQWQDEFGANIPGQTISTINNICQGIYNLEVRDQNGCSAAFGPVDLTPPAARWDISSNQTNITCSGTCDGTAAVSVLAGNTPPYTYLWDDPSTQMGPTATGFCAGNVSVVISDATVCDTMITFNIIDVNPILANANITNIACFGNCSGAVIANPSGGVAPYTITFSNGVSGPSATGLCVGPITLNITDASGCSIDTTINITEPAEITVASSFANNAACTVCNGSASVNVSGGVTPYTFNWTPTPTAGQGTNNATGLCSGVIAALITDANGCTFNESFGISDIPAEIIAVTSNDASCFDVCDGDAEVTFVCSDPACSQEWYNAATGLSTGITASTINALCAGDYFVEVVNNAGCISVEPITIDSPTEIIANEVISRISCNGGNDGQIELFPSGGSGAGYTYAWSPAPPNGDGTSEGLNLTTGIWEVTITDGSGCSEIVSYNLLDPTPITITPTSTNMTCSGVCDGTIRVNVVGGGGGFTYQWFNAGVPIPGEISPTIVSLCAGNYNVEVTDLNGCVIGLPLDVSIGEPVPIAGPIASTDVTCFGACDGVASVTVSGGVPPYTINWFDAVTSGLIGIAGTDATNLCPGEYFAIITDVNGCGFTTATDTIIEPIALTEALVFNDASCFGICDGDATLNLAGGTLPYVYEWLDISGAPIPGGTDPALLNVCAGNYTIEGTDGNGCTVGPIPFAINGFPELTGTVFTNDANCGVPDGSASINPAGGNAPYTFQWFDNLMTPILGEMNNALLAVGSGTYNVEVTDANGCARIFTGSISDLTSTVVVFDATNDPLCVGGNDGSIEITATSTSAPLTFTWNPSGIVAEDPSGLSAGDYTLEVTDNAGCTNFYTTTLVDPDPIVITSNSIPTDCGLCSGEISITMSGGSGALTASWNNGIAGTNLTGLCAGFYEVRVTDANGCTEIEQIEVTNNGGLAANTNITSLSCAGSCDGEVTVIPAGGVPPYSILWLHDGSTNTTINGLCSGTYFATITDSEGCQFPVQANLTDPNPINAVQTITTPTCGLNDGSISIMTSGGILPHTYLWASGGTTSVESLLGAGAQSLVVTDVIGCQETFVFTLNNTNAPIAVLTKTDVACNGVCSGSGDTLSITGNSPYVFDWQDDIGASLGTTTPDISSLCEGEYILQITDNTGCIGVEKMQITEPELIILNPLFALNPSCNGICDGTIISNPIGGSPGYTFAWDDPSTQTTAVSTDLCGGTFTVDITDNNGCQVTQSETLVEPAPIVITVESVTDAICLNSREGEIDITATGGVPSFTYEWVSQTFVDTIRLEDPTGLLPMNYSLTVTDANGCIAQDTISVDTLLIVLANAGLDTVLCFQDSLKVEGFSNVGPPTDYTWYDATGTNIVADTSVLALGNLPAGYVDYILQVDFSGCSDTDTIRVLIGDELSVDAGPDADIFPQQAIVIGGSPTIDPLYTAVWSPGTGIDDVALTNPTVSNLEMSTWYYATVIDSLGCTEIDSMFVTLLPEVEIPDGISPDGNGLNDTWILDFIDQYPGVSIKINVYNRWGDLLFESDETYEDDWGGTTEDGKNLPAGTYYYVIDVDSEDFPDPFTGPITIMW